MKSIISLTATSLLLMLAGTGSFAADRPGSVVATGSGPAQGSVGHDGIHAFKGLRYGAPPVGDLRFKPPVRPEPWAEPQHATAFGPQCMQSNDPGPSDYGPGQSEDCLVLNVWTPGLDDRKRPVMFWIHGGAWRYGSGALPIYHGDKLAHQGDVVVVTINHRLNVFGYLHLADILDGDYEQSGVAGMLDIVLALEWVRDNVSRFGGNPNNVTVFGESGGGLKISHLLAMPQAEGLFHRAIIQSGPGLSAVTPAEGTGQARELLKKLEINPREANRLKAADAMAIFQAQSGRFAPVINPVSLPRDPFVPDAPPGAVGIPLLIGTNKDEGTFFMRGDPMFGKWTDADFMRMAEETVGQQATRFVELMRQTFPSYSPTHLITGIRTISGAWMGSLALAERKLAQSDAPVYMYMLQWESPVNNGMMRAAHAVDLPLVFNTVPAGASLVGTGPEPQIVADQMSAAWIAFARYGDPNAQSLPFWPTYDRNERATMLFNTQSRVENDPWSDIRELLQDR